IRREPDERASRWERARLDIERRGRPASIRYTDPRRFGRLVIATEDIPAWRSLGVDPLVDGLDARRLARALRARRRSIKDVLMDQSAIAGIGNIQATEALWLARIDPRSRVAALSPDDVRALARAVRTTIARALAEAGSELEYLHEAGATNPFRVYG